MSARTARRLDGFATRLMVAQLGVLLASVVTAAVVAALVGPRLFHDHLLRARGTLNDDQVLHAERAYLDASLLSLGVALAIAIASASLVTWYLARRLRRPLTELSSAARAIALGRYDRRVAPTGAGAELDEFADSFNVMATRLEATEDTRRRLLTDLAHEMRTPLATCTAYLEALDDDIAHWGPETSAVLGQQVARLSRLAADIDDVSRAEEGRLALEPRAVPVGRLVETAVGTARPRFAERGVGLVLDVGEEGDAEVWADAQRVGQVFANLLDNALRHTPAGGTVRLAPRVDGDEVVVEVQDDGDGIPAEQLPHVFERFYRGDSARDRKDRGSGIGLTISRAIVDSHGGSLTAHSAGPGQGATFEVRLPMPPGRRS
ncbi:cell wall metabolism sensor histidine kinase WalK [uncultured Phycicoccus sp.]|uniref:sensor histidine kinase n=1 Tax=uncultured Phycicoccus sp. TaxID=661422 RepID=UPI002622DB6E|nr:ATP-binding protein [uncultured Phycicoccus sp.]